MNKAIRSSVLISILLGSAVFAQEHTLPERNAADEMYENSLDKSLTDFGNRVEREHTCIFFESATAVTFIGSPTNGANGDVTNLVLPGGIYVSFSGHDVRHADGRRLQRLGIQRRSRSNLLLLGCARREMRFSRRRSNI